MTIKEQNRNLLKTSFLKNHLINLIEKNNWDFKEIKKYLWRVHKIKITEQNLSDYLEYLEEYKIKHSK